MKKQLVAAIALSLSAGVVLAADAPSQSDLKKVKAYGNTSVADDSVQAWGPWTEFAATAAGPQATSLERIAGAGPEQYRSLPVATGGEIAGVCAAGSICGYGSYSAGYGMMQQGYGGYGGSASPMKIVATNVNVNSYGGAYGSVLSSAAYGGSPTADLSYTQLKAGDPAPAAGSPGAYIYPQQNIDDSRGKLFMAVVSNYVSGQYYFGIVGNITPTVDMSALRSSGMVATYYGYEYNGSRSVSMTANIGQGTWTGSFDSYQGADQSFKVTAGSISGSNFASSQLTTTNVSGITGKVQGSFIGSGAYAAQSVIGVSDVTLGGARQVTSFQASQGRSKE